MVLFNNRETFGFEILKRAKGFLYSLANKRLDKIIKIIKIAYDIV